MQRPSLSCLADIACTSSSTGTRRCASNVAKRTPQAPLHLPKERYDKLERTAKGLITALSKREGKRGWTHETSLDGETRRLTQAVKGYQNPARMPSQEKQQFFADPAQADWDTELIRLESHDKERLPLGALVELRRGIVTVYGVVVGLNSYFAKSSISTLTTTGEVWPSKESDATFVSLGFIPLDLVERCGKEDMAQNDHQIAARVHVLKRLRDFQLALERRSAASSYALKPLYTQLKNADPHEWSRITTLEAARLIDPKSDDTSMMSELIAQRHLFEKSKYFEAEQTRFLASKIFWVRPQRHVEDIETVDRMVKRKDPRLDAFVRKARQIITSARDRNPKSRTAPMAYEQDSRFQFDPDELTVIRFFVNSIRPRRFIQVDPYLYSQCVIIKQLGLYPDREVDGYLIHDFLIELGILPPWEDRITRSRALWDSADEQPLKLETLPDVLTASTSRSSPTQTEPLGPEDFYSHDIVDSLRHDFGNMPVYVVDDVGAEELDDGVSVERIPSEPGNNWLHVHIADPTSVLPPSHSISRHAFEQIQTLYFVDRTIPLLPHVGTIKDLSLGSAQGGPQLVMSFSTKVDSAGNILDYKVRPGIVRNVHVLHYDDVDAALGLPPPNVKRPFDPEEPTRPPTPPSHISQAIVDDILHAGSITRALLKARISKGYHGITAPGVLVSMKPRPLPDVPPVSSTPYAWSGFPELSYQVSDYRAHETGTRGIVAEAMRTANRIASLFFRDHGVPAIRRIVPPPTTQVADGLEQMLETRDENGFVDKFETLHLGLVYSPAQYGITPGIHGVLGIPADEGYMRVTSPLRRFSDMLIHWQIKHALLNPSAPACRMFSDEWLLDFAKHSGFLEEKHKRIAALQNTYWANLYILRWRMERQRGLRDGPDPLNNLVARVKEHSMVNSRKQYYQQPVLLQNLGLSATLVGLKGAADSHPLGASVDVKIDAIGLGLLPLLDVVRK